MPPERSHAEASRLRARQSRIAKVLEPPVHLLWPCKRRLSALFERRCVTRARVRPTLAHASFRPFAAPPRPPLRSGGRLARVSRDERRGPRAFRHASARVARRPTRVASPSGMLAAAVASAALTAFTPVVIHDSAERY